MTKFLRPIAAIITAATLAFTPIASHSPLEVTASAATSADTNYLAYPVPTRVIYYNPGNLMCGDDVAFVQSAINFILGTTNPVDRVCGEQTSRQIAAYQSYANLTVDSCAGPETIAAILRDLSIPVTISSGYNSDYVIDIKDNASANNTPAQIYPSNGTNAQIFTLNYEGNGFYSIVQKSTGKVLDVMGSVSYATYVNLYDRNNTDAQMWRFESTGVRDEYRIVSKLGLYLTVNAVDGTLDNTRLCTYPREERLNAAQTFTIKPASASSAEGGIKLHVDMNKLAEIGHQSVSGPCGTFCLSYANLIENGTVKSWQCFSTGYSNRLGRYSYCADWSKMGYRHHYTKSTDKVWKACYQNLKNGKPTLINVKSGRSSGDHYIVVAGAVNVSDPDKLSAKNFLILDPAPHSGYELENFSKVGYKLRADGDGDYDYIC